MSYLEYGKAVELIGSKELLIDDLGYFKQEAMMDMSEKEAYFLSRSFLVDIVTEQAYIRKQKES